MSSLRIVDDLRTFKWYRKIKYPELINKLSVHYLQYSTAMQKTLRHIAT
jgi:hypothetical protein